MTGLLPTQTPFWQVSVWVQALPSLQAVPLGRSGFEQRPVAGSQTPAAWHWSIWAQTTPVHRSVPLQTPCIQTSFTVFGLPSLQGVPSGSDGFEHWPDVGSQTPAAWHGSDGWQTTP